MIITIALLGESHVTKMAVYPSETMREVVARMAANLDSRVRDNRPRWLEVLC